MGLNLCSSCTAECRHHRDTNEITVKCGAYKPPMTNADRIRAKDDEGLARWVTELTIEAFVAGTMKLDKTLMNEQERLDWLQQPASEEGNL